MNNDPSGHLTQKYLFYDADVGKEGLSPYPVTPDRIKTVINEKFGVAMQEDGVRWSLNNLYTGFNSLSMINGILNGHLKSMVSGTSFVLTGGGNMYKGMTYPDKVVYYVFDGNVKIPITNFLHETGHLLDFIPATADVFSGPLVGTTPGWIDSQGFVDETLLLGQLYQQVQAKYIKDKEGNFTEAFHPTEYWADAFANYVAGNIDLSDPNGKNMYDYVFRALERLEWY